MINGLRTDGFDLHEKTAAGEMIDRMLIMLENFLISNQALKLNETFKVYLKILSIDHLNYKRKTALKTISPKKRTPAFYKKQHFGGKKIKNLREYNYYWAIDIPRGFPKEPLLFEDKCLLISIILGLLQNNYFKSEKKDKRFLKAQLINSSCVFKKNLAGKIIADELSKLIENTKLPISGPYQLNATSKLISKLYNCQIFVFDGISDSKKLSFMFPSTYNDSLQPIYLYCPLENPNHLVFIRHLNSYFRGNKRVCFGCKKTFQFGSRSHLCASKKTCFACRRFFATDKTYLHMNLKQNFCDKEITLETETTCKICNVILYSQHCLKTHRLLCNGKGSFGFRCLQCFKFTYRYGTHSSTTLKEIHQCGETKICKICFQGVQSEEDHLCKLKKEYISNKWPRLAFITIGTSEIMEQNENFVIKPTKSFF